MSELSRERPSSRTTQVVNKTLIDEEASDLDRVLVGNALVVRKGDHYRIESGAEGSDELEARAQQLEGRCDCGELLSSLGDRSHCRSCGRDYRVS